MDYMIRDNKEQIKIEYEIMDSTYIVGYILYLIHIYIILIGSIDSTILLNNDINEALVDYIIYNIK